MKVLQMLDITKTFGATRALSGVNFDLEPGEVHALLGENGAGKSTLINILGGILPPDRGSIVINGDRVSSFPDVLTARRYGIAVIHQEIVLVPHLSVAENIFLGREPFTRIGLRDKAAITRNARSLVSPLELDLDVERRVEELSLAQQQMVEIVKAISFKPNIVVMDEPTSALSLHEVERLFEIVRRLKASGVSIVYITHRLEEIFDISDRVTVLRDGTWVGTKPTAETDYQELVKMMVGRSLSSFYSRTFSPQKDVLLSVEGLTKKGVFEGISFTVHRGEVVGFSGLVGAGRSEIMASVFGAAGHDSGTIRLEGEEKSFRNTKEATDAGLALVPEDRKRAGLVLCNSVEFNLTLAALGLLMRGFLISAALKSRMVDTFMSRLNIRAKSPYATMSYLSGGNQQKVVLAKWLATRPKVLILDEPTRGIDVGAKEEIYSIIDQLAKDGMGVVLVSSELEEIVNLCDTVCVVRNGRIVKTLAREEVSQEHIMQYAAGAAS